MDPPIPRNEPCSVSSCIHLCCAAHPPSSSLSEVPGNPVAVTTWVCLLPLLPWMMIKNSSVAVTTWVVSDIISTQREHPKLVAVPTQPVDGLPPLPPPSHHDVYGVTSRAALGFQDLWLSDLRKQCSEKIGFKKE